VIIETILGAATGLIGNVVSGIFNYKTQKIEMEKEKLKNGHELAMVKAQTDAMIAETQANIQVTKAQIEGEIELADVNAYVQSQREGNKPYFGEKWVDNLLAVQGGWRAITVPVASLVAILFMFVDFLRGLMRPLLTAYLTGMATWITLHAWQIMNMTGVDVTTDQAVKIFEDTTSIIIYLTVSCITWWFGDRRMAKSIMQLKQNGNTKKNSKIDEWMIN